MTIRLLKLTLPSGTTIEYPDPAQFPALSSPPPQETVDDKLKWLEDAVARMEVNIAKLLPK